MPSNDLPHLESLPDELESLAAQLNYSGRWAPLYVEPIVGSGERFTFAIAVQGDDGAVRVSRVIRTNALRSLYGRKAAPLSDMLASIETSIAEALQAKRDELPLPLEGFAIGRFRRAIGRNIEDLIEQGRSLCASLAAASSGEQLALDADEDERRATEWAGKVQKLVTDVARDLSPYFGRFWTSPGEAIASRFGYFDGRYVAHFGVVRKENPNGSLYHLKARLWELQNAKGDLGSEIRGRDLLLARPKLSSASISLSMRDRVRDVLDNVTRTADQHQINVLHFDSAPPASRRLYEQARKLAA